MTVAVLDRPRTAFSDTDSQPFAGLGVHHGRGTLEELLDSALKETRANGSTECPVCHARMALTRAHAECGGCGSRLI